MGFPRWLLKEVPDFYKFSRTMKEVAGMGTVCRSARCPNILDCFPSGHVTFMILGENCTRNCAFCAVETGEPSPVNIEEPYDVAKAAARLKLSHVVITSVTRDDLEDGGAEQFASTVKAIRRLTGATIELLVPDFWGKSRLLKKVVRSGPDVIAHNLETVHRLQGAIRPGADYNRSLNVLRRVKEMDGEILTKSGLILGLGESDDEVKKAMEDLLSSGCDILTLGQYRQPGREQMAVQRFILDRGFDVFKKWGYELGFKLIFSGTYVRSSYRAGEVQNLLGDKKRCKTGGSF